MTAPTLASAKSAPAPEGSDTSRDRFAAVWATIGAGVTALAADQTIRHDSIAKIAPKPAAGDPSVATLPRISIALAPASDAGSPEPRVDSGDIRVTGLLGEGGMGRVLLGKQRSLSREVAVKTVREHLVGTVHAEAILGEGLVTGQLEHPNIIPIHQLGKDHEERPVLVMKRVVGVGWNELLADPGHEAWSRIPTLPDDRLRAHLEILMQVSNALSFAHSRGVIHRDVKPENVMVGEFGEVYLVDWGIALRWEGAARAGLVGTPSYLAPEMLDVSLPLGPKTDVYLLGGVLHTILTGRPRHEGATIRDALLSAFTSAPVAYEADVPVELGALANRATARDPGDRPESALAFRREIASYLSHRTSVALSREAADRLEQLGALTLDAATDPHAVARLGTECRFAFLQALREWSDNQDAKAGLHRTLATLARVEIRRENAAAARALLGELAEPDEALEREVTALEARLARRADEEAALRRDAREQDLTVGQRGRRWVLGLMMLAGLSISTFVIARGILSGRESVATTGELVWIGLIPFSVSLAAGLVLRKRVLTNEINRRLYGVLTGSTAFVVVHRALAFAAGTDPSTTLRDDMFILAVALATSGILVSRAWLVLSALMVAGAIVTVILPTSRVELVFGVTTMIALASIAFVWRPARRERANDAID